MAEDGRGGGGELSEPEVVVRALPPGIGAWSLLQIFKEAGRLLHKHFGDFGSIIVILIVPASFITALRAELYPADFVGPSDGSQGSTDPEGFGSARLLESILISIAFALPHFCIFLGACSMFDVLTNAIYSDREATYWHNEHLLYSMKLALAVKGQETENPVLRSTQTESSLYERFRKTSKGKKLKALGVVVLSIFVYHGVVMIGINFTREEWPCMFLWFALAITVLLTCTTSYLILVNLVLSIWLCSPSSFGESSDLRSGKRGSHEQDPLLKPKLVPTWTILKGHLPPGSRV